MNMSCSCTHVCILFLFFPSFTAHTLVCLLVYLIARACTHLKISMVFVLQHTQQCSQRWDAFSSLAVGVVDDDMEMMMMMFCVINKCKNTHAQIHNSIHYKMAVCMAVWLSACVRFSMEMRVICKKLKQQQLQQYECENHVMWIVSLNRHTHCVWHSLIHSLPLTHCVAHCGNCC